MVVIMEYLATVIVTLMIISIPVMIIYSNIRNNKRLKTKLILSFGKPPTEKEYEINSIKKYSQYKKANINNELRIDDITWNDLNMDTIFKKINVCLTSIGEEYLYNCLQELRSEPSCLLEREKMIDFFAACPDERLAVQFSLAKVGKVSHNGLSSFIFKHNVALFKHPFIFNILSIIPLLCALLLIYSITLGVICILISFVINLVVFYISKRKLNIEIQAIIYFSSVLSCCKKLCRINNIKTFPMVVKLKKKYDIFKPLESKLPIPRVVSGNIMEDIFEYLNILFLIDIRNYNKCIKLIIKYNNEFHSLYKSIGELDLALCVLSFRKSLQVYSIPEFHEQNTIVFEDIFHPLIASPVKNSGMLMNDTLITGSNASGKSTFIKALAINGILAQTIYTTTALKFKIRFSIIITSMAMRDDLLAGDSYFIAEIKSLKRIMDLIQKYPCTCFIDEILRGTNTIERIASSSSVLDYLHSQDCLCIVASHDIELTNILADKFDNNHFCEQITNDEVNFDYKLKPGPSTTRNAIKLLGLCGFNPEIVKRAEKMSLEYDKKKLLWE
jgi:DNA mismatch repair ATPase MutS